MKIRRNFAQDENYIIHQLIQVVSGSGGKSTESGRPKSPDPDPHH